MKGYVYTLEVMLAVAVIMFMIVLIFSSTPEQPETNIALMKQNGYDALQYLDNAGLLQQLVSNNSVRELKSNITALITSNIVFDAAVCQADCTSYNVPRNRTVVTVDYYVSAYKDVYLGKKVRLWMWQLY
jgi:hypothetical protein